MALTKGLLLAMASLVLNGELLHAEVITTQCGSEMEAGRSVGLDRTAADTCVDRFAVTDVPPERGRLPVGGDYDRPADNVRQERCVRFVPALAMTLPVDCP